MQTVGSEDHPSATATAADILKGKTAWVNGSKITGNGSNGTINVTDHTETSITLTEDKPIVIVYARYAQAQWTSSSNSAVTYPTITITGNYDKEISFNDGDAWWVDENSYYRKNGMTVKVFTNVKVGTTIDTTGTTSRHILY